jgi:Fic family protein
VPRGREHQIVWNGARILAWVPELLAGHAFEVGTKTARRTEQAAAAVTAGGREAARFEPIAMLLLRTEGIASSFIEGLRVSLVDVAAAEIGDTTNPTAKYIADNLAAVVEALGTSQRPLTIEDVHNWHRRLMRDSKLPPEMLGSFRTTQSWIGGTSPRDAALVPPPPELVTPLMEDLIEFINDEEIDAVSQAAVAHAQFETIHPYGDGNGRIGRILIGWIIARRLDVALPPPVSVFIARDPGGYLAGITMFRLGYLDLWVDWVAAALRHSSEAAETLVVGSDVLIRTWIDRLADLRQDSTARKTVDILAEHPVVSSDLIAARLGVSERSGRFALRTLADRGIVQPYEKHPMQSGRPRQYWVAGELIELVSSWPGT